MTTPKEVKDFLDEIESVCRKHGISISHEDGQGAFILEKFNERDMEWLKEALYSDLDLRKGTDRS